VITEDWIRSPTDERFEPLLEVLRSKWEQLDSPEAWPAAQLAACARYGVFSWFIPAEWGGQGWSEVELLRGYLRLSQACLTTAFVLTQRSAAVARIAAGENEELKRGLLPRLLTNEAFTTVGISHLTTSRLHVAKPVLRAEEGPDGFYLDGYTPWGTGAAKADTIVIGATLEDGRQVLGAIDANAEGVTIARPERLVGMSASQTGRVDFHRASLRPEQTIAGPRENVMKHALTARTGGLQTSALAIGLAGRALEILQHEAEKRLDLVEPMAALVRQHFEIERDLLLLAEQKGEATPESIRQRANDLVLRATQAALIATKGAGYVAGHPAGRLCREALFFLVWSCPQPVTSAHLCELAGLG
jgi:alkylation response protein AidB-like acyl-CoA dehydrogenase